MSSVVGSLCNRIRSKQDSKEPISGNRLVCFHLLVMLIIDDLWGLIPWVEREEERFHIVPMVEGYVSDHGTEREVRCDQI